MEFVKFGEGSLGNACDFVVRYVEDFQASHVVQGDLVQHREEVIRQLELGGVGVLIECFSGKISQLVV